MGCQASRITALYHILKNAESYNTKLSKGQISLPVSIRMLLSINTGDKLVEVINIMNEEGVTLDLD